MTSAQDKGPGVRHTWEWRGVTCFLDLPGTSFSRTKTSSREERKSGKKQSFCGRGGKGVIWGLFFLFNELAAPVVLC